MCSLRAAISAANESEGGDQIRFAIDGAAVIAPSSPLPPLRDAEITLDATTQPGWSAAAPPLVYLDGRAAGDAAGIVVNGAGAVVRGLAIGGFARYGIGVIGAGAADALVEANWLGMTADGLRAAPNRLSGAAVLGGATGARIRDNRIAGNSVADQTGHGIVVGGGGVAGAQLSGNTIGLNAAGRPLANDDGVLVVDGAQAAVRGNVICASAVAGVEVRDTRGANPIDGNRIGVDAEGRAAANRVGVFIGAQAAGTEVGRREANIIAANEVGIAVEQGAREVELWNNWIGLVPSAAAEPALLPNARVGISIIEGAAQVRVVGNRVLAGERGIVVGDAATSRISLQRNQVASEGLALVGIEVREAVEVRIGGDRGLGNMVQGVGTAILLTDIEEAVVSYNRIGAPFASLEFGSAGVGVGLELGAGVRAADVRENQIGGVDGAGIRVSGPTARDNLLTRNVFGANGGLDIEVAAGVDAPTVPIIDSYAVERLSTDQLRSTIRGRGDPGSSVELYVLGEVRFSWLARARVDAEGRFTAITPRLPEGGIRALSIARLGAGATSEFSQPFPVPARQPVDRGLHWIAIEGDERPVAEALAQLGGSLEAAWRLDAASGVWRVWSPNAPPGLSTLRAVRGGDVLGVLLSGRPPREFYSAESARAVGASLTLEPGLNSLTWTGPWVSGVEALERLDEAEPGLLGIVWQWDAEGRRWRVIWPRLEHAWEAGDWGAPALAIRARRAGVWEQGGRESGG